MDPPLSDGSLASLYSSDYYGGTAEYAYTDERIDEPYNACVWDARINKIRSWVSSGRFLDIGCSFGGFLVRASRYYTPYGIEISAEAAAYAENRGITVHTGSVYDCPFEEDSFAVATMIEVIEHLKDPVRAVSCVYSRLQPGGIAVIQTADMNAWQAREAGNDYHYYLPGHVSYFSETNLTWLLSRVGFSEIRVYRPVDFGLLPKLCKMRASFTRLTDYLRWFRASVYHVKGYFSRSGIPLTSSMVVYARK
ncbi:MAG: class I SAM-dependent methyltransferase [Spirochaetota bacterium]